MKKIILSIAIVLLGCCSYAQNYLPLSGGTLTGTLVLNGAPFVQSTTSGYTMASGSSATVLGTGSGTDYLSYIYGNNPFSIWTNNQRRLIIDGTGNVGIGITSPGYKLDIYKGATGSALNITGAAVGTRNDIGMDFSAVNAVIATYARIGLQITTGTTGSETGGLTFSTVNNGSLTEKMFIDGAGKVGIGTTTPTTKLDIVGGTVQVTNPNPTYTLIDNSNSGYNWAVQNTAGAYRFYDGTQNAERMRITSTGNVGIGTIQPDQKLTVNGTIHSKEVKVDNSIPVPDYVFEKTYKLPALNRLKLYLDANHHLPEIPSAAEIEKNGLSLGEMNLKLLKKVEELTLYVIEKDKQLENQQKQINELTEKLNTVIKSLPKN